MAEQTRKEKRRQKKRRRSAAKKISAALFLIVITAAVFLAFNEHYFHISGVPTVSELMQSAGLLKRPNVVVSQDEIAVHFIDVGQGDCALVKTPDKNLLIDCGEAAEANQVISYLRDFGVKRLDYVIITHPHSDHMGGMYRVLSAFDVGAVLMPAIPNDILPDTDYYRQALDVIEDKNIVKITTIQGQYFDLCEGTSFEILGPIGDSFDDLNDFSVVAKLTSGNYSFLFTGDMEKAAEYELMDYWINVRADVIKVGHHGSASSTSTAFLKRVKPQYAVISVGENSYGHPTSEVLKRLESMDCEVFTTMNEGSIVFVTDGNELRCITTNSSEGAA